MQAKIGSVFFIYLQYAEISNLLQRPSIAYTCYISEIDTTPENL